MKRPIPVVDGGRKPSIAGRLRGAASFLVGGLAALISVPAGAEVRSSSAQGFIIRIETQVAVTPIALYDRIFQIGQWWSDAHTYSGKAANMRLEKEPGGCFCESLSRGGFARHAAVEYADVGKVVRLSGALGPLQPMGATGMLSFDLAEASGATRLVVTYTVSGYQPDKGFAPLAAPVDSVLNEQVARLKRLAEMGAL